MTTKRLFLIATLLLFLSSLTLSAQSYKSKEEAKGLAIGTKAPAFSAINQNEKSFQLQKALKKGPVVMIFYRGHWCPNCNKHLGVIQDSLGMIYDLDAQVVAISPEKPEKSQETQENTKASFSLLYDEGYKIADAYDVTFLPAKAERMKYNNVLSADLKTAHSDDSERLPIPATYIIGKDGTIVWRHFNPNHKKRSSVAEIVSQLEKIN